MSKGDILLLDTHVWVWMLVATARVNGIRLLIEGVCGTGYICSHMSLMQKPSGIKTKEGQVTPPPFRTLSVYLLLVFTC